MKSPVISLYAEGTPSQRNEALAYLAENEVAYYYSGAKIIRIRRRNPSRVNALERQLRQMGLKTWRTYDRHN